MSHACKEVIPIERVEAEDKSGDVRNDGGKVIKTFTYNTEEDDNEEPEYTSIICKKCKTENFVFWPEPEYEDESNTLECRKCRTTLHIVYNQNSDNF